MGYHTKQIPKGKIGEPSKIREEFLEFEDALQQQNPVMQLVELSDLLGAIDLYTLKKFNLSIYELLKMTRATQSAFIEGERS
jgi:hypothetical protein